MASATPGHMAVEARNLVKRYGVITAVDSVSFQISRGEIVGFLGANGAGKTTTLRMLCGLLTPTSGAALIDGLDIVAKPLQAKARLGYLDEEPFVHRTSPVASSSTTSPTSTRCRAAPSASSGWRGCWDSSSSRTGMVS